MGNIIKANSGKGLMRRREANEESEQTQDRFPRTLDRETRCLIKNSTGEDLEAFSVILISGATPETEAAKDIDRAFRYAWNGVITGVDNVTKVAINQQPVVDGAVVEAVHSGVTPVRIKGPAHKLYANAVANETTLLADDTGAFEILSDEADDDDSYAPNERIAIVRFATDPNVPGIAGTGAGCECKTAAGGSILLNGVYWPVVFSITGDGNIIFVAYQGLDGGNHVWESDLIDEECDEGTDQYQYTLTAVAGSNAADAVLIKKTMINGGGYGGDSACCEFRAEGYEWSFYNAWEIDPLATFEEQRKATEFLGRVCDAGAV